MNRANNKNYAQAAAAQPNNNKQASHTNNHHQNQHHHHQQVSQHNQSSGPTTSSNFSSSTNGKPVNNNSQTKPQAQHNSTMGNGNTGRSQSIKQKNPITLPTNGHPWENGSTNLIFGSVNSPNAQISSLPSNGQSLTSGGGIPTSLPTKGPTFGTLVNNNNNSINNNNNITTTTTTTTTTNTIITNVPTTQAAQATQVPSLHLTSNNSQVNSSVVGNSGSMGANNNNNNINNNNNNNSNNNNSNGTSNKSISARTNEPIPRTHSAPPLGQSSHTSNVAPARINNVMNHQQQQPAVVPHQQPVNNPPINNRKDSVSSNVSSNDGQPQPFHPHHSTHNPHTNQHSHHYNPPHHRGHNNHNNHNNHNHHNHHKPNNVGPTPNQYNQRSRDKNGPHLSAQPVQTQVPMAAAQLQYGIPAAYNRDYINMNMNPMQYYQGHHHYVTPGMFHMPYAVQTPPRPPIQQPIAQVPPPVNFTKQQNNKRIEIIDPLKNAPIQFNNMQQQQPQQLSNKNSNHKRDDLPTAVSDKKLEESDKEKERPTSDDKNVSRAVPIVNPEDKDKEERERKEQEEKERLEKEKAEQVRREEEERLAKEEKERKEREEKEKEKRERDEKERLEREREKEEQERKEREERERKEREERERKEREERERKEREERERLEAERKEKEEKEKKEREEREERERIEQERLAKEKREKEEQELREQEERKRLEEERIEKERKEAEEKKRLEEERKEKERKEAEEKKRLEEERVEKERKEAEEKALKEKEEKEREEKEEREKLEAKKKEEEEEAKTKALEEAEKNKDDDKKDPSKKEEKKLGKSRPHPGPLDLSRTTSPSTAIPSAPPSALNSARLIEDLNSITYPPNIRSPKPELNSNAKPMKFKYDRDFLMQFMSLCIEKPDNLPALEAIDVNEAKDDKKNNRSSRTNAPKTPHRSTSNQSQFTNNMTEFKFPQKSGTTSEERFAASMNMRNGASPSIFGRGIGRTGSGSNLLPPPGGILSSSTANPPSPRASSGRRGDSSRRNGKHQMPNMMQDHQVAPLERSENRWIPGGLKVDDALHVEAMQRKVKALLNKLTLEKFDSISDQIIDFANRSRDEKDGGTLREVIRLIFEKSCDESNFCAMYAQLCRKMMERVDPEIVDENVKNTEGRFVQGGTLFRKYLLNRCQEEFEKGWKVNIPLPSNEKGEPDLMSDEYYAAAKAKRQGLGLIRFIGELFKLNMLTERIMHECIKKLLIFQGSPEEEEMESLCKLLNTVGEQLDHCVKTAQEHKVNQLDDARAKQLMDSYFNRLDETSKLPNLSSRIKFMIMDVIDLRSNFWKPRRDINAPKTIAEIHEDAAKQKEEAEFLKRTSSSGGRNMPKYAEQMSRSGSGRRDNKGMQSSGSSGNDGWSTVGSAQRNKDKAGDLSKFGSVNRSKISGNVSLAPGGILGSLSGGAKGWTNKSNSEKEDPKAAGLSRTNSTSNTYSVLTSENSEGRKSSDSSISEAPKPMERKKIVLAPRTLKATTTTTTTTTEEPAKKSMSEEEAKKKINSMLEEYFSVLDHREVVLCIKDIPAEYHAKAIEAFACKVIEKKQKDVDNVMKLFKEISSGTCDTDTFKNGFKATLEFLMDIGADAPLAYSYTGQLLFSAGLDFRDTIKLLEPLNDDFSSEKIFKGYASALKNNLDDDQKYAQKIKEFDLNLLFPKKDKDEINQYEEDLLGGSLKK